MITEPLHFFEIWEVVLVHVASENMSLDALTKILTNISGVLNFWIIHRTVVVPKVQNGAKMFPMYKKIP